VERDADVSLGKPLARLDLGAIRARVEGISSVKSAEVSRSWPLTVHIEVTERTPIAVINQGNGLQALDEDGVLFGHYADRPRNLPLVIAPPDTAEEALVEGGRVIGSLPDRIASRVDTVEVTSVDKIQLVLGNGRRVLWGSAEDSGQKAEVLAVLLKRPGQQIDVSVPDPAHHPLNAPPGAHHFSFPRATPACCAGTPVPATYLEYTTSG